MGSLIPKPGPSFHMQTDKLEMDLEMRLFHAFVNINLFVAYMYFHVRCAESYLIDSLHSNILVCVFVGMCAMAISKYVLAHVLLTSVVC